MFLSHPKTCSLCLAGLWLLAQEQAPLPGGQCQWTVSIPLFSPFPSGKIIIFSIIKTFPKFFSLKILNFLFYVIGAFICINVCTPLVYSVLGGQRASDSQGLELYRWL